MSDLELRLQAKTEFGWQQCTRGLSRLHSYLILTPPCIHERKLLLLPSVSSHLQSILAIVENNSRGQSLTRHLSACVVMRMNAESEAKVYQKGFLRGQVLALTQSGLSTSEVSTKLEIPRRTVYRWLSRGCHIPDGKSSGRPSLITRRTNRRIRQLVRSDPSYSLSELSADVNLSRTTVWRRLKKFGYLSRKKPSKLNLSERHKLLRLQWSMKHCHWRTQWSRVVWSDEAAVRLRFKDGRLSLWLKSGKKVPDRFFSSRSQNDGKKLLIWGAIWSDGHSSLHIMEENMTSELYVGVLEDHVYPLSFSLGDPSSRWILMDDNAPPHRSIMTRSYKQSAGIRTLDWPARSPDLNPIEHVWAVLKRRIRRQLTLGDDLARLKILLRREWDQLDQEMIGNLISSMPNRIRKVIELEGDESGY